MATAKRGLGRGLSALIPDEDMELFRRVARDETPQSTSDFVDKVGNNDARTNSGKSVLGQDLSRSSTKVSSAVDISSGKAQQALTTASISLEDIEPNPYQPRRTFDEAELDDLAASLREHGVIQPIVVRPSSGSDKKYQLVAGERRWRAAQKAGLLSVPAIVRSMGDLQALELALIENVQRHDISAIDAALAYRRLADEFHLSQEDISRRVGKSRSAVANTMRLLDLQPEIRKAIEDGSISEGHGRAILLAQGEAARRALLRRIIRDHLSVRDTERQARELASPNVSVSKTEARASDPRAEQIEKDYNCRPIVPFAKKNRSAS